jgi:hypothetical protein
LQTGYTLGGNWRTAECHYRRLREAESQPILQIVTPDGHPVTAVDVTVSASEITDPVSNAETPTADASPAISDEASDARAAQPLPEVPCPAVVDAVDAAALPREPSAPIESGTPADNRAKRTHRGGVN